uniref:Uncharacterized protein n=1 Tax=Trypanosoma congolense (strain IL3000) TaxID=1068625 RepID=G0UPD2_TRYCI|nr:conserved hypothetical protein [Trypanosoma congolense IL3000]
MLLFSLYFFDTTGTVFSGNAVIFFYYTSSPSRLPMRACRPLASFFYLRCGASISGWHRRAVVRRVGQWQSPALAAFSSPLWGSTYGVVADNSPSTGEARDCRVPVWEQLVENIEEVVQTSGDSESWRRLCLLWQRHFTQSGAGSLPETLEEELLTCHCGVDTVEERVPRDLWALPVFVQALCAAIQQGLMQVELLGDTAAGCPVVGGVALGEADKKLLSSVIIEMRVVVFYLAQERLVHVVRAVHEQSVDELLAKELELNNQTHRDSVVVQNDDALPSRDVERVSHMGTRLSPESLQQVIMLAEAAAAVLSIHPPNSLLPAVYQLLLPALGVCEQLDSQRLGDLATAFACSTDFDDPRCGIKDICSASCTPVNGCCTHAVDNVVTTLSKTIADETLKPVMTPYTVLSHMNALSRALELLMRGAASALDASAQHDVVQNAKLRLLPLKERKKMEQKTKPLWTVDSAVKLLDDVSVVSSALSSRRYMDKSFWSAVFDFTALVIKVALTPHVLLNVRHILFALHYANQLSCYERLMTLLVQLGVLEEPVPSPSEARDAMKSVPGKSAAAFQGD